VGIIRKGQLSLARLHQHTHGLKPASRIDEPLARYGSLWSHCPTCGVEIGSYLEHAFII
jgi:hypothetical protein